MFLKRGLYHVIIFFLWQQQATLQYSAGNYFSFLKDFSVNSKLFRSAMDSACDGIIADREGLLTVSKKTIKNIKK